MCIAFIKRLFKKEQAPPAQEPVKATMVIDQMRVPVQDDAPTPSRSVKAIRGLVTVKYPSVTAAAKATGINRGSIHACLTGKRKSAGGYTWKYCETDDAERG